MKEQSKYVYLIQALESGRYKIGVSKNPKRRVKQLQTGSNEELRLVESFMSKHPHIVEKALHNKYSYLNSVGEWYDLSLLEAFKFLDDCENHEKNFTILKEMGNDFL